MQKESGIICTRNFFLCPQMINANRQSFSLLGIAALLWIYRCVGCFQSIAKTHRHTHTQDKHTHVRGCAWLLTVNIYRFIVETINTVHEFLGYFLCIYLWWFSPEILYHWVVNWVCLFKTEFKRHYSSIVNTAFSLGKKKNCCVIWYVTVDHKDGSSVACWWVVIQPITKIVN